MRFRNLWRIPSAQNNKARVGLAERIGLPASATWNQISRKAREKYEARELGEVEYERILEGVLEGSSL